MKKLFIVVLLAAFACKQKQHSGFTVSGAIRNATGKKVSLIETSYANGQPVILDTASLKPDGSFSLKGRASEESIYRVEFEKGPAVILINDNNDIRLEFDINNYRSYTVQNSPASESLHDLFESYRSRDSAIYATFTRMENLRQATGQDSALQILQQKNDKQVEELNELLKNFIENSSSPAATVYALGMADQTMNKDEVKKLASAAVVKFPAHAGVGKIQSLLASKPPAAPQKEGAEAAPVSSYPLLNKQAPELVMNNVNGKPVSISSFKGKYVLVDFWASWCGPCRQENSNVVAAFNQFKNKNFTVLGVSLDNNKSAWIKAIAADKLTWTHMSDLKKWESAAVTTYGFEGIPFNVLIDPTGKIIASALREEQLFQTLQAVLK